MRHAGSVFQRALVLLLALVTVGALVLARDAANHVSQLRQGWAYVPVHGRSPRTVGLAAGAVEPLDGIAPLLALAVVANEDRRFFQHRGFDLEEIGTALRDAWRTGRPPRGASTISQQLVKNLFLSGERSLVRKLREVAYTALLEAQFSKAEILALYLSVIEWGDGVYGAAEASARYFGIEPDVLTLDQAALLSAVIPAPRDRGRGIDLGSMHRVGTFVVVRRLRRLHLLVDALAAEHGGRPLRLADFAAARLDVIIDPAEADGYPTRVCRAAHRSYVAIRRAFRSRRAGAPA